MSDRRRPRASDLIAVPENVTDPLLWRLAIDVAAAHQPGNTGRCGNLQCASYPGTCPAAASARRAMRLACHPQPTRPALTPSRSNTTAVIRVRAAVPPVANRGPFAGWITDPARAAISIPARRHAFAAARQRTGSAA